MRFKLFGHTFGCFTPPPREGAAAESCEWRIGGKLELFNPVSGDKYLTRYVIIRTPFFRVFLHRFHGPDPDRHLHNHPWRATSWILKGGYVEEVAVPDWDREHIGPGWDVNHRFVVDVNQLREDEYHRIRAVLPGTWSLVIGGAYFREWGFLVDGEHIDWRTYLNIPAAESLND